MEFYFYIDTKNSPIWQKYHAIESMERGLYCLNGVQSIKPRIRHSHMYRRAIPWIFLTWIRNIKNYVQKVNNIRKRNYTIAKSAFQYHDWLICLNFIVVLPAFHNRINFQLNTCQCRTKHTSHFNNIYVFLRSAHNFIVFPFFLFFSFKIYMKMDAIRELLKLLLMLLIALFHRP